MRPLVRPMLLAVMLLAVASRSIAQVPGGVPDPGPPGDGAGPPGGGPSGEVSFWLVVMILLLFLGCGLTAAIGGMMGRKLARSMFSRAPFDRRGAWTARKWVVVLVGLATTAPLPAILLYFYPTAINIIAVIIGAGVGWVVLNGVVQDADNDP